jgi:exodeoxyribonuclease X
VHGISNTDVADAGPFAAIQTEVVAHLGEAVIVGHNVGVDLDVLRRKLPDWRPAAVIDTLRLARRLLPDLGTHRLGALVEHLGLAAGLPDGMRPHRADYDVLVTARLLHALATQAPDAVGTWEALCELGGPPTVRSPDDGGDRLF